MENRTYKIEKEAEATEILNPISPQKVMTWGIYDLVPAYLVIMSDYSDQNGIYLFMLNVTDMFSKYI